MKVATISENLNNMYRKSCIKAKEKALQTLMNTYKYMYLIFTGFHHGAGSSILNEGICHGSNAQIKKSLQRELGHYK